MVRENVFISFCSCNQRIQAKLFSLIAVMAVVASVGSLTLGPCPSSTQDKLLQCCLDGECACAVL